MLLTDEAKDLMLYSMSSGAGGALEKERFLSLIRDEGSFSKTGRGFYYSKEKLPFEKKSKCYKDGLRKFGFPDMDFLRLRDSEYPGRLKEIADPPKRYYAAGNCSLKNKKCVAISGSREASDKGKRLAGKIAGDLAKEGIVVIAGLAQGIETAAHIGALRTGQSACVLPCGLARVYPPENRRLKESLFFSGRVLSEYEDNEPARREHFPQRNRIIIGLSVALVVIESGQACSALHMADMALNENREVLSVPGEAYSENWEGSNRLIQQGAKLIHNAKDILDEIARA